VVDAGGGPQPIAEAVALVREGIAAACARAGRASTEVRLLAVTKTVPIEAIRATVAAGVLDLAENHAKDLAEKAHAISATWHFLGKLQSGTASKVAEAAQMIHSGEPGRALQRLARRAAELGRSLDCLAQVDFTGRRQGVEPPDLASFLEDAGQLQGVRVVGLMTVPPLTPEPEGARAYFARLRQLRDGLRDSMPELVELSMGMSRDYTVAVEEGATMVRVGTALFGPRPERAPKPDGPGPDQGTATLEE
jgi:pyridoxal phosphate enzyme (YggS family)